MNVEPSVVPPLFLHCIFGNEIVVTRNKKSPTSTLKCLDLKICHFNFLATLYSIRASISKESNYKEKKEKKKERKYDISLIYFVTRLSNLGFHT